MDGPWTVEPSSRGNFVRIDSSTFPDINLFFLLGSFWLEAGVDMRPPHCKVNTIDLKTNLVRHTPIFITKIVMHLQS
jgi:hypothetical protein